MLDPRTDKGRRLLGHELIHTVQQRAGAGVVPITASRVSDPGDVAEREADAGADALAQHRPFTPTVASSGVLARDVEKPTETLGQGATFSQAGNRLTVTVPLHRLFAGLDLKQGFTNRLLIRANLLLAGGAVVATTERHATIVYDLWDEDYKVSVEGGEPTRHKTADAALTASWSNLTFPSAVVPGASYVVTGEAMLNLITQKETSQRFKESMGRTWFGWLSWYFTNFPPDRADAWVTFRTPSYTAR
jgi:hypothetical protein